MNSMIAGTLKSRRGGWQYHSADLVRVPPSIGVIRPADENPNSTPALCVPFRLQHVRWAARCCRCPGRAGKRPTERHGPPHRREGARHSTAARKGFRGHRVGRSEGRRPRAAALGGHARRVRHLQHRRGGWRGLDRAGGACSAGSPAGRAYRPPRPPRKPSRPAQDFLFRAAAARISVLKAAASISSPSWISMARRVLPSRLELNSPEGSLSEAPLAKVSFTMLL
jgi:hypothetical protein